MTTIKKDLDYRIMVDYKTDFIYHSKCMLLKIDKLDHNYKSLNKIYKKSLYMTTNWTENIYQMVVFIIIIKH